jgi:hypothetical protein
VRQTASLIWTRRTAGAAAAPILDDGRSTRRSLRDGGTLDLRDGHRPQSVQVVIAENRAQRRLAYQLSGPDRGAIDAFEQQCSSLLILTRYNDTAVSLRSFFNRRVPLWEGYTRYALDGLVAAVAAANGNASRLGAAVVAFMGEVGIGFTRSAFGDARSAKAARPRAAASPRSCRGSRGCCWSIPITAASLRC